MHGNPLSLEQYAERYRELKPNGDIWDVYPPNEGAVLGTKWTISSVDEFIKHFGSDLDRIGESRRHYLGILEDACPASFEERGLPISSLNQKYYQFSLTGKMPEGWTLEVSEIAPAFGRDGGGLQLIIKDAEGLKQNIIGLLDQEVIRDVDGGIR
jgi:hypothetical protein